MRSTQAVPGSTGGTPARSTARPHPHLRQECGIQAETCTQGQQCCLLCHTPSKGRLTNKSRPARSKQAQPAQPARHKTSPRSKSRQNCNRRLCRTSLAANLDMPATGLTLVFCLHTSNRFMTVHDALNLRIVEAKRIGENSFKCCPMTCGCKASSLLPISNLSNYIIYIYYYIQSWMFPSGVQG